MRFALVALVIVAGYGLARSLSGGSDATQQHLPAADDRNFIDPGGAGGGATTFAQRAAKHKLTLPQAAGTAPTSPTPGKAGAAAGANSTAAAASAALARRMARDGGGTSPSRLASQLGALTNSFTSELGAMVSLAGHTLGAGQRHSPRKDEVVRLLATLPPPKKTLRFQVGECRVQYVCMGVRKRKCLALLL